VIRLHCTTHLHRVVCTLHVRSNRILETIRPEIDNRQQLKPFTHTHLNTAASNVCIQYTFYFHDEQLHTNGRRCYSSTSAVCQSVEVDRSALSSEQFWSLLFCCCGPVAVDLEFAARQSSRSSAESQHFRRQLKTHFFAKY